ncbi:MAG TPA: phage tail protein [Pyrinomonadaceae bacterium]
MDANGTTFYLLLGEDDWSSCTDAGGQPLSLAWAPQSEEGNSTGLEWNRERNELTLQPKLFQFIAAPKDNPPRLDDRRGAGRDRFGNWYWIDRSGREILVNSAGSGKTTHFWASTDTGECKTRKHTGDFEPREPKKAPASLQLSGLCVTEDHYLVAGVMTPAGILIFDLHGGGEPRHLQWPESVPFVPFDMSPRRGGGVFVLDRLNRRFWTLDRYFNVIKKVDDEGDGVGPTPGSDFQPQDGSAERRGDNRARPAAITLDASSAIAALDPISIEGLPDGTVLVLDRQPDPLIPFSLIYHYYYEKLLGPPVSTAAMGQLIEDGSDFELIAHDFAFVAEHDDVADRLYLTAANGNQTFAFNITEQHGELRLFPLADFLPMRLFGGKGLVAAGTETFYDFSDGWIPLKEQRRPRYEPQATLLTPLGQVRPPFDGREPDCVWHRLTIDACIPSDARIGVWSRAANDETDLAQTDWQPEPRLYLRDNGSELPFAWQSSMSGEKRKAGAPSGTTSHTEAGTWELLFQRARGRYLQLKIALYGNGRTTPHIKALRAYYPRFSYLGHYMPAVYREDDQSASFLDRFLANVEGFYTSIEDKIAAVQVLFDVYGAPPETLEWLSNWFGMALDPAWNQAKRRLFIKHAMRFFQYRGTIRGLLMALRLAFDDCADETIFTETEAYGSTQRSAIRIIERFRTRRTPGVLLGDPASLDGPRMIEQTARWLPANGAEDLSRRYREALSLTGAEVYPLSDPAGNQTLAWQQFSQDTLGFIPSTGNERRAWQHFLQTRYASIGALNAAFGAAWANFEEVPLPDDSPAVGPPRVQWNAYLEATGARASGLVRKRWQDYLARRYQRAGALNAAHGTSWPGFESVSLPNDLPSDGPALQDWYRFEAVVLAMQRTAHRFTVMLPVPKGEGALAASHQRQRELTERIVDLEKPAHTIFDVKFYWAMFRLGEARLGFDTLIDYGSRAPQLIRPMILGQSYLAEAYLAPEQTGDAMADRLMTLGCEC